MPETCQFCDKNFLNKNSLTSHQKKTKYCLIIQGKLSEVKNKCSYCDEIFSNDYIKKHTEICPKKLGYYENKTKSLEEHIIVLNRQISYLEGKVEVLEKNPKTINIIENNNNNSNNTTNSTTNSSTNNSKSYKNSSVVNFLAPLNDLKIEDIEKIASEKFAPNYLHKGQPGIAQFCKDHIVNCQDGRKRIMCSDPVRMRFKIKESDNTVNEDIEARYFINKVSEPIKTATKDVYQNVQEKYANEQKQIDEGVERKDGISKEDIEYKKDRLVKSYFDILNFDNTGLNKDFLKEFSKLTKV